MTDDAKLDGIVIGFGGLKILLVSRRPGVGIRRNAANPNAGTAVFNRLAVATSTVAIGDDARVTDTSAPTGTPLAHQR